VHFGLKPVVVLQREIEARSARELRHSKRRRFLPKYGPGRCAELLFEMLSAAARAQRQFVADTAHQLRTPIAACSDPCRC